MKLSIAALTGDGRWISNRTLLWLVAIGLGALGLVGLGSLRSPRAALQSYLLAFAYWAGVVLAGLLLLQIWHASRARWVVVLRRPLEALAASAPILLLLFVPVALGMRHIYPWVDPDPALGAEALELLHHKRPYLNVPFFLVRTAFYLLLASWIAGRLYRWSVEQDASRALHLTRRQWRLGAGTLPPMALAFAFASFDWLMSLQPLWYSTIFGVYYFAGSIAAVVALLTLVVCLARGGPLGRAVTPEHLHNLGKLLLAFTCFWAYIAFSQLLLIWLANLPEEVPFFSSRLRTGWRPFSFALGICRFAIPFVVLLSRDLKRRPRALSLVAVWILLAHALDLYWLVMPAWSPQRPVLPWTIGPALFGVGALVAAATVWRLRGKALVPIGDPYLPASLEFRQP
jgi:hypothetical protein